MPDKVPDKLSRPLLAAIVFTNGMADLEVKKRMASVHFRNFFNKHRLHFERVVELCDRNEYPLIAYVKSQVRAGAMPHMLYSDHALVRFLRWWSDQYGRYPRPSERDAYMAELDSIKDPIPELAEEYRKSKAVLEKLKGEYPFLTEEQIILLEQHRFGGAFLGMRKVSYTLYEQGEFADAVSRRITQALNHILRGTNLNRFKELANGKDE
jgi:hypothetical protein